MSDKLKLVDIAKEIGNITLNEINELLGFQSFDGGNIRMQSLNYINAEIADKYQMENKIGKEGKEKDEKRE